MRVARLTTTNHVILQKLKAYAGWLLILGGGKSLFNDIDQRKKLKLMDTKTYSTGLVQLFYEVEK